MEFAPDPFAELTLEQLAAVNDACDRFEAALRDAPPPRVEDFLAGCGGAVRDALLRELLILAFEDEVSRQGAMDVVGTAERFPDDRAAVQAAAHEARNYAALRHEPGANPGAGGGFPEALDGFRLKAVLGRGAFGTVFLADAPDGGEVALKVPHLPVLISSDLRQRFLREAEAAGGLDHPNLIAVREIREAGLVCFTVSDYVPGGTLADWLRDRRGRGEAVPPRLTADLIVALAGAIQYAHGRGVLHCDLKPANVLLRDGRPDAPLVTDFGVARLVGQPSDLTQSGQILGTPAYMAPEQADGRRSQVTAGTDVYGLGAILYEMLTGHPPFPDEGLVGTLRRVLTDDPVWPRVHARDTPPGLEAICLKCLEKSPARRYASAADLAADLARYLDGLPPSARHPGVGRRLSGWTRRHPLRAAAVGFALLSGVAVLAAAAAAWAGVTAKNRDLAEALGQVDQKNRELEAEAAAREGRARRLRARVYADDIRRAEVLLARNDPAGFRRLLDAYRPEPGGEDLRGFEWYYLDALAAPNPHRVLTTKYGRAYSVVLSPDGRLLAVGCQDGMVRFLDPDTGREVLPPLTHPGEVRYISFAPDGGRVATACADGGVRVWPVGGGGAVVLGRHDRKALAAVFSPDGRRVASGGQDGVLSVWDLGDGAPRQSIRVPFESQVRSLVWTSDGQTLVTGQEAGADRSTIKQWDAGGRLVESLDYGSVVGNLVVAGGRIVSASRDGEVRVWEYNSPTRSNKLSLAACLGNPGDGRINDLALTRDGASVAVVREAVVEVWRVHPLRQETVLRGHDGRIWAACFADGGNALITAGEDGTVRRWDLARERARAEPLRVAKHVYRLAFDPAGRRLAAVGPNALTMCAFGKGATTLCQLSTPPHSVPGFDAVGDLFTWNGTALCRWNAGGSSAPVKVASPDKSPPNAVWTQVAFEPGGRLAAYDGTVVRVWGPAGGGELGSMVCPIAVWCLAFGPGDLLAAGCGDRKVRVWDARTFELRRTMDTGSEHPRSLAVSRDGRWLACGCGSVVKLWCLADETGRTDLVGHRGAVKSVAFSPDGRTLASGGADGTVRLWQVETGSEMLVLQESGAVDCLAFSPCGGVLALGGPPSATEPSQLFLRGVRRGPP